MEVRVRLGLIDECFCEFEKGRLDVFACLGTGHEYSQTGTFFKLFYILLTDLRLSDPLLQHVHFIRNHSYLDIRLPMLLHFVYPLVQVQESLPFEKIEDQDDSLSPLIVSICYGAVAFLAGCVPDLQLYFALAVVERPKTEVDSDSCDVVLIELIICKADQCTGFTY